MASFIIFALQDAKLFHLAFKLQSQQSQPALPVLIARRLFVQWPECLAFATPDILLKGILKGINHSLDTVINISQRLVRIEVAARPCEVLIFEKSMHPSFLIKQESERWRYKFSNLSVNLVVALSCISILSEQCM